jgi:hypothetical protein
MAQEDYFEVSCFEGGRWVSKSTHQHRNDAINRAMQGARAPARVRVAHEVFDPATHLYRSTIVYDSARRVAQPAKPTAQGIKAPHRQETRPGLFQRVVSAFAGRG